MKDTDYIKDIESIDKRNLLSSNDLHNSIKNLSSPRFLGSIHLKKFATNSSYSIDTLLNGELELKINKSLRNTMFNPITKLLVISMICFNLFWLLLIYLL